MNLKQLINKSVYGTIGYISSQDDLNLLEQYILYNLPVLKEYKQVIVATNYKNYPEFVNENTQLWKKYFPDCIILDSKINRGHQVGTTDLDKSVIDYCKENDIKWLCKSANDVILQEKILDKQIDKADFYYLIGIGYAGVADYNFNFDLIIKDLFYPQTNFYIIDVSKIDTLLPEEELKEAYKTQKLPDYKGNIQLHIDDFCCERILQRCILRNNLTHYNLIPENKYKILLQTLANYKIADGSHKNILIEGICHYHYINHPAIEI
jgi:hypothetical protein